MMTCRGQKRVRAAGTGPGRPLTYGDLVGELGADPRYLLLPGGCGRKTTRPHEEEGCPRSTTEFSEEQKLLPKFLRCLKALVLLGCGRLCSGAMAAGRGWTRLQPLNRAGCAASADWHMAASVAGGPQRARHFPTATRAEGPELQRSRRVCPDL